MPPAGHQLLAAAPVAACPLLHKVHNSPFCTPSLPHGIWVMQTPAQVFQRDGTSCQSWGGGTQLSTQPATQSLAGTVCLSLNSSCPSGVIIASQRKVGATIQSHHTDLPHRATMYRKTESYITARRDQSRKAWVRKERGAWRRGLLSLRVLTLLSLPGETMRR